MSTKQTYIVFSVACMIAFFMFQSPPVAEKAYARDLSIQTKVLLSVLITPILNLGLVIWGLGKKPFPIPISVASILLAVAGVGLYNYYNSGEWVGYNIRIDILLTLPLTGFNLAVGLYSGYLLMMRSSSESPPPSEL